MDKFPNVIVGLSKGEPQHNMTPVVCLKLILLVRVRKERKRIEVC